MQNTGARRAGLAHRQALRAQVARDLGTVWFTAGPVMHTLLLEYL